jgi:hypothetical protein
VTPRRHAANAPYLNRLHCHSHIHITLVAMNANLARIAVKELMSSSPRVGGDTPGR